MDKLILKTETRRIEVELPYIEFHADQLKADDKSVKSVYGADAVAICDMTDQDLARILATAYPELLSLAETVVPHVNRWIEEATIDQKMYEQYVSGLQETQERANKLKKQQADIQALKAVIGSEKAG